jgi:hypothetical protein
MKFRASHYIVDPTKLQAFSVLEPIFHHLSVTDQTLSEGKIDVTFTRFFALKKWYIAPVGLQPIDKLKLGVSFLRTETQQIAFQNESEIWIDKTIFDKMTVDDQANLIAHEFVMSLYLLKYQKVSEICRVSQRVGQNPESKCEDTYHQDELMPPPAPETLSPTDYQAIRRVTDFLTHRAINVSGAEFAIMLGANGFDPRFFHASLEQLDKSWDAPMAGRDAVAKWLIEAQASKQLPVECIEISSLAKGSCSLNFTNEKGPIDNSSLLTLNIDGPGTSPSDEIQQKLFFPDESHLTVVVDPTTNMRRYLLFFAAYDPSPAIVGKVIRLVSIILVPKDFEHGTRYSESELKLAAVISNASIITRIDGEGSNKSCKLEKAAPQTIGGKSFAAVAANFASAYFIWMAQYTRLGELSGCQ